MLRDDLRSRRREIASSITLAVDVRNVFDAGYATFGVFGDAEDLLGEDYAGSRRFVTPAAPRTFAVSLRARF